MRAIDPGASEGGADTDDDRLLRCLALAPERGEFSLVYQRQVAADGETLYGVESLLRWQSGELGVVGPERFVRLAEQRGAIRPITRWVLEQAMIETASFGALPVGFNASALEFADPQFVAEIAGLIERCAFDPARLEIEVTETAILANAEVVRRNMDGLHELGVRIALDDFGAGYSSLNHLRLYPFDTLKIDKAFVDECSHAQQSAALIHAVVGLGKALGMKVVAEGVETKKQMTFLSLAGVDAMQGFLFGKPIPAARLGYSLSQPAQPLRGASPSRS